MRRSALQLGLSLILIININALPKRAERSVDLNEQYKRESACVCDDIRPQSYIVEIEPQMQEAKFKGRVRINVTLGESANKINLLAHPDLQIADSNIKLTRLNDVHDEDEDTKAPKAPAPVKIEQVERTSKKLVIHLEKKLLGNTTAEIDITYAGNITINDTSGLFMNHYTDAEGNKHTYVATYLRLNNARKVFPSFDELQYKAKFQLVLTRPKNLTALSNTPIEKSAELPGNPDLMQDRFVQTPEMTTYQLGFVISDLECMKPSNEVKPLGVAQGKQLQVRVWARNEFKDALKGVPERIVDIVNYLQDYFNSSIHLTKLDVVALPGYSASKASDNWGLAFFKEGELSSPLVWNMAYEMTYQWIGQYITPYRWMDASENKGLNSFLASMATMDINPDELKGKWPMNILYSLYYGYGKTLGANRGTGIIRDAKFAKIELVFRMFHYILGKDNFKASMQHLIHSQSMPSLNKTTGRDARSFTQSDIYDSMNFVATHTKSLPAGLSINEVADTWIDQERLPLVTVTRHYDNKTITFSQKPYVREAKKSPSSWESSYQWNIPLVMQSRSKWDNSDYRPKAWLLKGKSKQDLNIPDIDGRENFVVVNPEEIGLFPVNYDPCNWQLLSVYLQSSEFETIPALTRAKLLHDSWNLAYADEVCFKTALNMTLFLKHEKSHIVWEPFFTMIDHVGKRIDESPVSAKFNAYARSLLEPMYTEPCVNPQPGEPSWKTHLRGLARYFLCNSGYEPCIATAREHYKKWMTDAEPDSGNPVANEFLCPVFKWGTEEEWNFGLQRVINFPKDNLERKMSERTYLLKTLAGCARDPNKIEKLLNVSLIERNSNLTDGDAQLVLSMLGGNAAAHKQLFKLLETRWSDLRAKLSDKKQLWLGLVQAATGGFASKSAHGAVSKLLETRRSEMDGAEGLVQQALEIIEQEASWSEGNVPSIDEWLTERARLDKMAADQKPSAAEAEATSKLAEYWKETLKCPTSSISPPAG